MKAGPSRSTSEGPGAMTVNASSYIDIDMYAWGFISVYIYICINVQIYNENFENMQYTQ